MAFKTAAIQAFKKGFMEASPVLLEPIVSMKITVDDKYTGDIMGDLNKRRGRVLGMNPDHKAAIRLSRLMFRNLRSTDTAQHSAP